MTLNDLDVYFRSYLNLDDFLADPSKNGIQISNSLPDTKQIKKIGFAVDACEATALIAKEKNCDMLFVHHGLFWGHEQPIVGSHYKRISAFIKNDIALYACHIPLDANKIVGNNYGLASMLNLQNKQDFGLWRGMSIGVKGELLNPITIEELEQKFIELGILNCKILPLGKEKIKTVGIISGGAGEDVYQGILDNLDCYITGEIGHENYHIAKEGKINVFGLGHYASETIGVNLVMKKIISDCNIQAEFIDFPTGL